MSELWELIMTLLALLAGAQAEPVAQPATIAETPAPVVEQIETEDRLVDDPNGDGVWYVTDDQVLGRSIGWVISPVTGNEVCVTGAPCQNDPEFCGPECSSYNWVTGEEN